MRTYLVKRRNELNLSQQDVANSIGISRQYFNSIENGTRQKKMDITLVASYGGKYYSRRRKLA